MEEFYLLNDKGLYANHWTFHAPNLTAPGHVIAFASLGDKEYVESIDSLVKSGKGLVDIAVINKIEMIDLSAALSQENDFSNLSKIFLNFPLYRNSQANAHEFVAHHLSAENQILYQKVQTYIHDANSSDWNAILEAAEICFFDQGIMLAAQRILGQKLNLVDFVNTTQFYNRIKENAQYECIGITNSFPEPFDKCCVRLTPEAIDQFNAQASFVLQFIIEFFERYSDPNLGKIRKIFAQDLKTTEISIREQGGIPGFNQETIQKIAEWIVQRIKTEPNLVICFSIQRLPLIEAIFEKLDLPLTAADPIPIIKF